MKEKQIFLIIFLIVSIVLISGLATTKTGQAVFDKGYFSRQRLSTGPVPISVDSSISSTRLITQAIQMRNGILDYLPHPYDYRVRDLDRTKLIQARINIQETTFEKYFARGSSLSCYGNEFFDLDMEAIYNLAQLGCLAQPRVPTGYEPRTFTVEIEGEPYTVTEDDSLCNTYLKYLARNAISDLIESERLILIATLKSSPCEVDMEEFQLSMSLAEENVENLKIDRVADNYRSAFIKALRCYCDW
ncbi:hypothetical protein JW851_03650 [Candidatus Woesearchaeota archaeon]|nr:hypothetical protein [Candidatus Woesearchaeota archaeon]